MLSGCEPNGQGGIAAGVGTVQSLSATVDLSWFSTALFSVPNARSLMKPTTESHAPERIPQSLQAWTSFFEIPTFTVMFAPSIFVKPARGWIVSATSGISMSTGKAL